jgi:diaminopropionate ammonia-lyase
VDVWYARPDSRSWRCEAPPERARAFHQGLPGYRPTPLVELPGLAAELEVGLLVVKDESARLGLPAFKVLGASWAVAQVLSWRAGLTPPLTLDALRAAAARGPVALVTATDGNHGRAVARLAAMLNLPAYVFVPAVVSPAAAAAIAGEGAELTRVDGDYDEAVRRAAEHASARTDAVLVQDVAWPGYEQVPEWIVQGYATLLLEVDEELAGRRQPTPDLVVVPVGVGSLAQAVVAHYRSRPDARAPALLGVEPEAAACVLASLRAGEMLTVPTAETIMAGLCCGTPSAAAWPYLRDGLDAAVAVSDAEAARAVVDLADIGVSSGPSGAASLAGARAALTGPGSGGRREQLGIGPDSVVVLLSTEARPPKPGG